MPLNGILGKKVGMTQLFDSKGEVRPVTVLKAGPCVVTQLKTSAHDGYDAAQIGLIEFVKESHVTKAVKGHLDKHNLPPLKFMREMAIVLDGGAQAAKPGEEAASDGVKVGDKVLVELFDGEKFVDVTGTGKGRGFAGVVKRHHFGGGPAAHGHMFQVQGSIGASSYPSRVFKGQRMSGHLGHETVTVRNLRVLGVDKEENLLVVEGAVPGPKDGYVVITRAKKPPRERRGFTRAGTVDPLKASKRSAGKKK